MVACWRAGGGDRRWACTRLMRVLTAARGLFPIPSRYLSMVRPLLDVVDQGEQLPLAIDFRLAAQRETIELLVVAEVAEHGFDGGEASTVLLFALVAVDAFAHALRMRDDGFACEDRDLAYGCGVGFAKALGSQLAVCACGSRCAELDRVVATDGAVPAIAMEGLAGRADRVRQVGGDDEAVGTEYGGLLRKA